MTQYMRARNQLSTRWTCTAAILILFTCCVQGMVPLRLAYDRDSYNSVLPRRIQRDAEEQRPENQACGLHPMDIFLTRMFQEIEHKQNAVELSSDQSPRAIHGIYGRLLYSFTLLHMTSPKAYNQLMNAMLLWDLCKSRGKQPNGLAALLTEEQVQALNEASSDEPPAWLFKNNSQ